MTWLTRGVYGLPLIKSGASLEFIAHLERFIQAMYLLGILLPLGRKCVIPSITLKGHV